MTTSPPAEAGERARSFEYYLIRVSHPLVDADELAGIVERLGRGEKRTFSSSGELLDLLRAWSDLWSRPSPR